MSAGKIAFSRDRFSGLGQILDSFPDRLFDFLLQKHAVLYNEFYSLLTEEEKEDLNANACLDDPLSEVEQQIDDLQKQIQDLKDDPYNTLEARRERFKGMNESVVEINTREFEDHIAEKESALKSLIERREELKRQQEQSILFN